MVLYRGSDVKYLDLGLFFGAQDIRSLFHVASLSVFAFKNDAYVSTLTLYKTWPPESICSLKFEIISIEIHGTS